MHWFCARFEVNVNLFMGLDSKGAIKKLFVLRKDIEKVSTLIKQEMMLVEGNIMDVGLLVFCIKDMRCKGVDNWATKKVGFKFKFKW